MNFLQHLLPNPAQLQLKHWSIDHRDQRLILTVSTVQSVVHCPVCKSSTHRVHCRYERKLQDLPCSHFAVTLLLQVRKFFCVNSACKQRIFTERLPEVTAPWSRRTTWLADHLVAIGLALGGAAGTRLSQRLGYPVALNPLLQLGITQKTALNNLRLLVQPYWCWAGLEGWLAVFPIARLKRALHELMDWMDTFRMLPLPTFMAA